MTDVEFSGAPVRNPGVRDAACARGFAAFACEIKVPLLAAANITMAIRNSAILREVSLVLMCCGMTVHLHRKNSAITVSDRGSIEC